MCWAMKPMLSCAGVGLYANLDSGIESNACAMLRCSAEILLRKAVVTGLAAGAAGGCWAARAIGATSATIAKRDSLIRTPVGMAKDCYSARGLRFPQSIRRHIPVLGLKSHISTKQAAKLPP